MQGRRSGGTDSLTPTGQRSSRSTSRRDTTGAAPPSIQQLAIDAVRVLSMDAVQKAESGHPGTPMALAPLGYLLYTRHIRHNPADPEWPDRDRFVLSCGHASMFLYSILHLCGYDLTLEDLRQFRQWESKTPGHPEYGYTPGVETTTGPLGQGVGNAVGMAMAEAHLASVFNRGEHRVVDHRTWFIASDGDLMEGISHEAASYAGHLRLGKLIGFYDDNRITIEGSTDLTYSDDAGKRFESYGWHVQHVADINDLEALDRAIEAAKAETDRPSMVVVRTHIGYGSPNKQDTAKAHGEALGEEEVKLTRRALGWPYEESFFVPPEVVSHWRQSRDRGARLQQEWRARLDAYRKTHPADAAELERRWRGDALPGWEEAIPTFTADNGKVASRAASGVVLNAIAPKLPELIGGSADLAGSTNTIIKGAGDFEAGGWSGRNLHYGVREHAMGATMNGMALHGGIRPYGATFLIFSDYMRPAIRLAAIMKQPCLYVFTHDSVGLGEDGPTHQPIEQLSTLRCIPGLVVIRPADANETAEAWRAAIRHRDGPVALVLTRQKLGFIDRGRHAPAAGVARGAYVLADAPSPRVVLIGTGSEVALVLEAKAKLDERGIPARVVSMPSHELFERQTAEYRDGVLPPDVPRVAVEAAHPMSWHKWVGSRGIVLGLERFGASAPYERIFEELGLVVERVIAAAAEVATGT